MLFLCSFGSERNSCPAAPQQQRSNHRGDSDRIAAGCPFTFSFSYCPFLFFDASRMGGGWQRGGQHHGAFSLGPSWCLLCVRYDVEAKGNPRWIEGALKGRLTNGQAMVDQP